MTHLGLPRFLPDERLVQEALGELERLGTRAGPIVCVGERTRDRHSVRMGVRGVYRTLVESLTAEQDARLRTTDRATRTVDERLENLRLDINCERQYLITEEILEIVSGVAGVS